MATKKTQQQFGGDWTTEKLERIKKYLPAYLTALKNFNFHTTYVDAFAGTGYNTAKEVKIDQNLSMFPEFSESDTQKFLDGSARIALQVQPGFDQYIFIEKDTNRFKKLEQLKTDFPNQSSKIELVNSDANTYIQGFCSKMGSYDRAVLFLDPFGMQVPWETIKTIAKTEKIDLWYLFPVGVAVNRLLKKDGNINESCKSSLDTLFGATDWFETFYQANPQLSLFSEETSVKKTADFEVIQKYLVQRLKTVFPGVASNPLELRNSKQNPLYLLCFAAGNQKGSKIAVNIAQNILSK